MTSPPQTCFSCETCGTQFAASTTPPEKCPICSDERQYIGLKGQKWTTQAALREQLNIRIESFFGMTALGTTPSFGINQRALLLRTDAGNILWETLPVVTPEAIASIAGLGGIDLIAISHPHFYSAMVEWSEAFGNAPILINEADREWVSRPSANIRFWGGDDYLALSNSVTLLRCGGHFEGSTVLHWSDGPRPGGALFVGDTLQVAQDRRHVSFMYSYPNMIPLRHDAVAAIRSRLTGRRYDDAFGYTWDRDILGGAQAAVEGSFQRYLDVFAPEQRTFPATISHR